MNSSNGLNNDKIESKDIFKHLKSNYILKKLFKNLSKMKLLDIIKYNKNMKHRLNISIKNYKEYSEIYSSIEIEIRIVNNEYGKFININTDNEKYYHIYFNNNKEEEIKRNYINKYENIKIKIINIIIDYQVISFKDLFSFCECIEAIYFKKFYRNNINNMFAMFYVCSSLKELNLNNFKTDNVIDMSLMFGECTSLNKLNLNNFKTDKVTNMRGMFCNCPSLKDLNLNNFNTKNVNDMTGMFSRCPNELIMKIKTQYKNIKEEAFEK